MSNTTENRFGKAIQLGLLLAVAAFTVAASLNATAQAGNERRSYMMTCRGGGSMNVQIKTFGQNQLIMNFDKAAQAATQAPIQPGQCAWQDRALRAEEPTTMIYPTEGLSLNLDFNPASNRLSELQISNNRGNRNSTPEKLLNQIRSGQPFFVQAHRSDDGRSFTITHVGL